MVFMQLYHLQTVYISYSFAAVAVNQRVRMNMNGDLHRKVSKRNFILCLVF